MSKYTPPPWKYDRNADGEESSPAFTASNGATVLCDRPFMDGNDGDLIVAAVNSYDKHCGPRAVECAEADLLGEALRVCESAIWVFNNIHNAKGPTAAQFKKYAEAAETDCRAILAKAGGK